MLCRRSADTLGSTLASVQDHKFVLRFVTTTRANNVFLLETIAAGILSSVARCLEAFSSAAYLSSHELDKDRKTFSRLASKRLHTSTKPLRYRLFTFLCRPLLVILTCPNRFLRRGIA